LLLQEAANFPASGSLTTALELAGREVRQKGPHIRQVRLARVIGRALFEAQESLEAIQELGIARIHPAHSSRNAHLGRKMGLGPSRSWLSPARPAPGVRMRAPLRSPA